MASDPSTRTMASSYSNTGNNAWLGADFQIPTEPEVLQGESEFYRSLGWEALADLASRLRGGVPCSLERTYSVSQFYLHRRLKFADDVIWVAKVRMRNPIFGRAAEKVDYRTIMRIEVGTLDYLKNVTRINVPTVHAYKLDPMNPLGAPFMLLDEIPGRPASEVRKAKGCDPGMYGTPEQDRRFRRQVAHMQIQLLCCRPDTIGSIMVDEETGKWQFGPDIQTGKGPWQKEADYFQDLTNHALDMCLQRAPTEVKKSMSCSLPCVFRNLMEVYNRGKPPGRYWLVHRDLADHNILVNDEFEVQGLADVSAIISAPIAVASQYPSLEGLLPPAIGPLSTPAERRAALQRDPNHRDGNGEYVITLRDAEIDIMPPGGMRREARTTIADRFGLHESSLYRGLLAYLQYRRDVNDAWMQEFVQRLTVVKWES